MLTPRFVELLETAVWSVARARFGERCQRRRELVESIRALSSAYGEGRPPRGEQHLLARLIFFTLADAPKIGYPLAELARAGALPKGALRLLDVGAGCGTLTFGAQGALDALGLPAPASAHAVDFDAAALRLAADVQQQLARPRALESTPSLQTSVRDLRRGDALDGLPGPFELILAGNVLTELPPERRRTLGERLLSWLAPGGALILLEPALRSSTQALHTLRDELLAAGRARLFAPCTHAAPCPLKDDTDAWCHELRIWQLPPPELRQLAAASGLRRRDLKFSYLTLRRPDEALAVAAQLPAQRPAGAHGPAYRCIGSVQRSKGKREVWLCGPAGRVQATRLDRHADAQNKAFERLSRGQLVWCGLAPSAGREGAVGGGRLVIDGQTTIVRHDPTRALAEDAPDDGVSGLPPGLPPDASADALE